MCLQERVLEEMDRAYAGFKSWQAAMGGPHRTKETIRVLNQARSVPDACRAMSEFLLHGPSTCMETAMRAAVQQFCKTHSVAWLTCPGGGHVLVQRSPWTAVPMSPLDVVALALKQKMSAERALALMQNMQIPRCDVDVRVSSAVCVGMGTSVPRAAVELADYTDVPMSVWRSLEPVMAVVMHFCAITSHPTAICVTLVGGRSRHRLAACIGDLIGLGVLFPNYVRVASSKDHVLDLLRDDTQPGPVLWCPDSASDIENLEPHMHVRMVVVPNPIVAVAASKVLAWAEACFRGRATVPPVHQPCTWPTPGSNDRLLAELMCLGAAKGLWAPSPSPSDHAMSIAVLRAAAKTYWIHRGYILLKDVSCADVVRAAGSVWPHAPFYSTCEDFVTGLLAVPACDELLFTSSKVWEV